MSVDISRVRFDAIRDFSGVLLQQGRLLLDGDFNEFVAIAERRLRAETIDLTSYANDPDHIGSSWVPRHRSDGFRVTVAGGVVTIGPGRMYVDGLLAENHGSGTLSFDQILAEETGVDAINYLTQPYWQTPDSLPSTGTHLAYLDVWTREITSVEDPGLIEPALGGPDTSGRTQTVWQVRLLNDVGTGACTADDDAIPGWLDTIRPSAGRLTSDTIEVPDDDDPCELPPIGGFRGLENQTYRIEVHDGGAPGTATFKWSRNNASVTLPVVELVSNTSLRVNSVGRDDILRVSTGDWVEVLDDHREFNQEPGEIRQVTVDDSARTISFTGALPLDMRPATADEVAARHLRVRLWDHDHATGLLQVPNDPTEQVPIEDGIAVSFSLADAAGEFHAGDYWIIAARTADASVELLDQAPPLGVHHHYAKLATLTFPNGETDCRRLWPPLFSGGDDTCGDCTVCVTVESHDSGAMTIQAAIDLVRATGGTVCIAAGLYDIGEGLVLDGGRSVTIRGQGLATILVARGTALAVRNSIDVTVERLAILSGVETRSAVAFDTVAQATLQDCGILSLGFGENVDGTAVALSGAAINATVRRNILLGQTGIDGARGDTGVLAAALRIEDNLIAGVTGIDLGGIAGYLLSCRVRDNEIIAANGGGIIATGAVAPSGTLDLTGNKVLTTGTGIAAGSDVIIDNNTIGGLPDAERFGADGIVIRSGGIPVEPGRSRISGNKVQNLNGTGIRIQAPVEALMIKMNFVRTVGLGITIEAGATVGRLSIDNNDISRVNGIGTGESGSAVGIGVAGSGSVAIVGNQIDGVGVDLVEGAVRGGIVTLGTESVRIANNYVANVAPISGFVGIAGGVMAFGPSDDIDVSRNQIRFSDESPSPEQGEWIAVLVTGASGFARLSPTNAFVVLDDQTVMFADGFAVALPNRADQAALAGNSGSGGGDRPTMLVDVSGDTIVTDNQCSHVSTQGQVAMQVGGSSAIVANNRVSGPAKVLLITAKEDRFSAVGNITPDGVHIGSVGQLVPQPWAALNPIVV